MVFINSPLSNEENPSFFSANFRYSNSEHVIINSEESMIVNNHENEIANIRSSSTSRSKCILLCEKLLSNLKTITKMRISF